MLGRSQAGPASGRGHSEAPLWGSHGGHVGGRPVDTTAAGGECVGVVADSAWQGSARAEVSIWQIGVVKSMRRGGGGGVG